LKILATYNIKGGVGKTAAAVNLAHLAAREGRRTLLWDLDPQGAASYLLRVKPRVKGGGRALVDGKRALDATARSTGIDGLDVLPSDFTYRNLDLVLNEMKKPTRRFAKLLGGLDTEYDLIVVDCPPGISLVSENVAYAADALLIPLIPATLSVRTLDQLTTFLADLDRRPQLIAFFSMVDRRKRLHHDVIEQLAAERDDIASTSIPALSMIEQMGTRRAPVTQFAATSPAARAYEKLWSEVSERAGL
jgi:chromosome partitioning protein